MNQRNLNEFNNSQFERLIGWPELRRMIPLSRATVWRRIRDGQFPKPLRISPGRIAWRQSELTQWQARQASTKGDAA